MELNCYLTDEYHLLKPMIEGEKVSNSKVMIYHNQESVEFKLMSQFSSISKGSKRDPTHKSFDDSRRMLNELRIVFINVSITNKDQMDIFTT